MSAYATKIRYLNNVPLDSTYRNTIYFASADAQAAYFSGLASLQEENEITFIKDFSFEIASGYTYAQLEKCNYIMYQNSGSSKWYYGFVTNVEYVADYTTTITFEIDVIQTWLFECTLKECWIERQHSTTDVAGDNLLNENFDLGEYKYDNLGIPSIFTNNMQIGYSVAIGSDDMDVDNGVYGGIYSGLTLYEPVPVGIINDFLTQLQTDGQLDSLQNLFMFPAGLASDKNETPTPHEISFGKSWIALDGYVPKNKKMFTYPYVMFYVTDNEGTAANYRQEFFTDPDNATFEVVGAYSPNPAVIMYPTNYNGVAKNYNEKMIVSGYPQCAWSSDTYRAYLAQNAGKLINNTAMAVISAAAGAATGNPTAIAGSLGSVASTITSLRDASTMPDQARGTIDGSPLMAINAKGLQFFRAYIHADQARTIDDFWTMFGYPQNRVAIPNRTARSRFTYIKTNGCNIVGSVPYNHMDRIKSIYDAGITWWMSGNDIGNYSTNNAPISGGD